MRVPKSLETRATTDETALPPKHRLNQKRRIQQSFLPQFAFGQLRLSHLQAAEERQKIRHGHLMEDGGPNPMPSQNLGIDRQKDLLVRGNYQELSHLSCSPQEKLISVTSTMIINLICNGVVGIGEAKLGIE